MTDHQHAVIVTSMSSGIGRAVVERLQTGYDYVVCFDIETGEIDWDDEGAHEFAIDVCDPDAVAGAVAVVRSVADVTALVNDAGISRAVSPAGLDPDERDRVLDVNLKGQHVVARAVAPGTVERGEGVIVNVSSVADLPFERIGAPKEVADVVVFLCDGASYMTGTALTVDGGSMLRWPRPSVVGRRANSQYPRTDRDILNPKMIL